MSRWSAVFAAAISGTLALASVQPAIAQQEVVVGMTYSSGKDSEISYRAIDGAKAYLERVNAGGGVQGRRLRLVALDSQNSPTLHGDNIEALIKQHQAVALLGCIGDALCAISGRKARDLRVPLIAPMSGQSGLNHASNPFVFQLRADYAMEAAAIAAQLSRLGTIKAAILSDLPASNEINTLLQQALTQHGMAAHFARFDAASNDSAIAAVRSMNTFNSVVMNLSSEGLETLIRTKLTEAPETWPPVLMSLSVGNQPLLMRHFRGRAIGFTQVVPNPEVTNTAIARELLTDAERSSPLAVTFEGMEGYLGARLLVEALRTIRNKPSGDELHTALETRESWNLAGHVVSFAPGRSSTSKVEIGMRSRAGTLIK